MISEVFGTSWKYTKSQIWVLVGLFIGYFILSSIISLFGMPAQGSMVGKIIVNLIRFTMILPTIEPCAGIPNRLMIDDRIKYPINSPTSTQIWDLVYFHEVPNTSDIINFGSIWIDYLGYISRKIRINYWINKFCVKIMYQFKRIYFRLVKFSIYLWYRNIK